MNNGIKIRRDGKLSSFSPIYSPLKGLFDLFFDRNFLVLTLLGNSFISISALFFYFIENGKNDKLHSLMDAFWFSFSTVCTVGYGDITPMTVEGKILGIAMMLIGSAFFATFTALFANAILREKFSDFKSEVQKMGKIEKQLDIEEDKIQDEVQELRGLVRKMELLLEKKKN